MGFSSVRHSLEPISEGRLLGGSDRKSKANLNVYSSVGVKQAFGKNTSQRYGTSVGKDGRKGSVNLISRERSSL